MYAAGLVKHGKSLKLLFMECSSHPGLPRGLSCEAPGFGSLKKACGGACGETQILLLLLLSEAMPLCGTVLKLLLVLSVNNSGSVYGDLQYASFK